MKLIIFYGECLLCHRFMKFIYKRDIKKVFTLISRDNFLAKKMMKKHVLTQDSIFYIGDDEAFIYSQAVLEVMKDLGGIYKVFYVFKVFPRALGDIFYRFIAKHRYKVFRKNESCLIGDEKN